MFTICGFCPLEIELNRKSNIKFGLLNIVLIFWSIFHFASVISISFTAANEFLTDDAVSSFNNILKFSIMALTYFISILESLALRSNFEKVWKKVAIIDESFASITSSYTEIQKTFYRLTTKKILSCLTFTIVTEIIIIANVSSVKSWRFMWLISIIPLMMSRIRHLQHTLYVDVLSFRFGLIKKELKAIVKITRVGNNELLMKNQVFYDGLFKRLSKIKNIYNHLWEASLIVNRSFGLSQL
jgi:hypothetical protein